MMTTQAFVGLFVAVLSALLLGYITGFVQGVKWRSNCRKCRTCRKASLMRNTERGWWSCDNRACPEYGKRVMQADLPLHPVITSDEPGYSVHHADCPYEHGGACTCE